MSIYVRVSAPEDLALLADLHGASFAEPWNAEAFEILLNVPGTFAFVAGVDTHNLQSFVLARVAADEAEILSLGTAHRVRRKGLARALVLATADKAAKLGADKIFLEVATDNDAARALYRGLGFAEGSLRAAYYQGAGGVPMDALTLRAPLPLAL